MNLLQDFRTAWQAGESHHRLLELVDRYVASGMAPRTAYDILEQLWLEYGYDDSDEQSAVRDKLEYILERTWHMGPAIRTENGIGTGPLAAEGQNHVLDRS